MKNSSQFKITQRRWDTFNKFQQRNKSSSLRSLKAKDGLKLIMHLSQFVSETIDREGLNSLSLSKANLLANIHSIFNKVKL